MNLSSQIESLLFTSAKPLTVKKMADLTGAGKEEVKRALDDLKGALEGRGSGLVLVRQGEKAELATHPENNEVVRAFLKDERTGELTRPSLEALTIIAYRGPITKAELEMIRGINCSLILRNLLIRGLITERTDKKKGAEVYEVSMDFLKYLGVSEVAALPDYERLNKDIKLGQILMDQKKEKEDFFKHAE